MRGLTIGLCVVIAAAVFGVLALTSKSARVTDCNLLPGAQYAQGGLLDAKQNAQYVMWAKCEIAASIKQP